MDNRSTAEDYFEWMYNLMSGERWSKGFGFRKLFAYLHDTEFIYLIPMDINRVYDGENLRYRYAIERTSHSDLIDAIVDELDRPCSVLELMIALAIKCEENFMDDPAYGDRTSQWFWEMIRSLGLNSFCDAWFDKRRVADIVRAFIFREYAPDGKGSLFWIRHCKEDLREVEIWYQLCWYINSIT